MVKSRLCCWALALHPDPTVHKLVALGRSLPFSELPCADLQCWGSVGQGAHTAGVWQLAKLRKGWLS